MGLSPVAAVLPAPLLRLAHQFVRYAGVGGVAAIGHYGTLVLAVELGGVDAVVAALAGYLVGGVISYRLNRRWTFASDRPHESAVPRFVLVTAVGFALTGLSMAILGDGLGLHYLPAQLLTTGLVALWTFSANRAWTFRPRPS